MGPPGPVGPVGPQGLDGLQGLLGPGWVVMTRDPEATEETGMLLGTIWLNRWTCDYWMLIGNITDAYQWQYLGNIKGVAGPARASGQPRTHRSYRHPGTGRASWATRCQR